MDSKTLQEAAWELKQAVGAFGITQKVMQLCRWILGKLAALLNRIPQI